MAYLTNHPSTLAAVKELSRLSAVRGLGAVLFDWVIVSFAIGMSAVVFPPVTVPGGFVYLLAVVFIATRQQSLAVLTHDGVHRLLLHPFWLNDWVTRWLTAFPVFVSLSKWRFIHLLHHTYTFSSQDPDVAIFARYPLGKAKVRSLLRHDVSGRNVFSNLQYFIDIPGNYVSFNDRFLGKERAQKYAATSDMRQFWVFWVLALSLIGFVGGARGYLYFLAYWILPYVTIAQVLFRLRGAVEHGSVPDRQDVFRQTRTYPMPPWVQFFFAPHQVNYHLEHHLYPSVPFYRLPDLHRQLTQSDYVGKHPTIQSFAQSLRALVKD